MQVAFVPVTSRSQKPLVKLFLAKDFGTSFSVDADGTLIINVGPSIGQQYVSGVHFGQTSRQDVIARSVRKS
jgi:hypothetical protein